MITKCDTVVVYYRVPPIPAACTAGINTERLATSSCSKTFSSLMSLLSPPEDPCLNWKQCSVLTFGLSLVCTLAAFPSSAVKKSCWRLMCPVIRCIFISNREQEVFLYMSWRCVTSEGDYYHCKHPIFVKHKILNAASVWLLKSFYDVVSKPIYWQLFILL